MAQYYQEKIYDYMFMKKQHSFAVKKMELYLFPKYQESPVREQFSLSECSFHSALQLLRSSTNYMGST